MRFSLMWPYVFTYIRHCMVFSTEIELQHVNDLWRVIIPRDIEDI